MGTALRVCLDEDLQLGVQLNESNSVFALLHSWFLPSTPANSGSAFLCRNRRFGDFRSGSASVDGAHVGHQAARGRLSSATSTTFAGPLLCNAATDPGPMYPARSNEVCAKDSTTEVTTAEAAAMEPAAAQPSFLIAIPPTEQGGSLSTAAPGTPEHDGGATSRNSPPTDQGLTDLPPRQLAGALAEFGPQNPAPMSSRGIDSQGSSSDSSATKEALDVVDGRLVGAHVEPVLPVCRIAQPAAALPLTTSAAPPTSAPNCHQDSGYVSRLDAGDPELQPAQKPADYSCARPSSSCPASPTSTGLTMDGGLEVEDGQSRGPGADPVAANGTQLVGAAPVPVGGVTPVVGSSVTTEHTGHEVPDGSTSAARPSRSCTGSACASNSDLISVVPASCSGRNSSSSQPADESGEDSASTPEQHSSSPLAIQPGCTLDLAAGTKGGRQLGAAPAADEGPVAADAVVPATPAQLGPSARARGAEARDSSPVERSAGEGNKLRLACAEGSAQSVDVSCPADSHTFSTPPRGVRTIPLVESADSLPLLSGSSNGRIQPAPRKPPVQQQEQQEEQQAEVLDTSEEQQRRRRRPDAALQKPIRGRVSRDLGEGAHTFRQPQQRYSLPAAAPTAAGEAVAAYPNPYASLQTQQNTVLQTQQERLAAQSAQLQWRLERLRGPHPAAQGPHREWVVRRQEGTLMALREQCVALQSRVHSLLQLVQGACNTRVEEPQPPPKTEDQAAADVCSVGGSAGGSECPTCETWRAVVNRAAGISLQEDESGSVGCGARPVRQVAGMGQGTRIAKESGGAGTRGRLGGGWAAAAAAVAAAPPAATGCAPLWPGNRPHSPFGFSAVSAGGPGPRSSGRVLEASTPRRSSSRSSAFTSAGSTSLGSGPTSTDSGSWWSAAAAALDEEGPGGALGWGSVARGRVGS